MPADPAVVDASALAALLFGEPAGPKVAERLEGRPLLAPTLLRYEVANVCARKVRAAEAPRDPLVSAMALLPRLGIREVQVPPDGMVELADRTGLTAYDAAYLWLASEMGAELITLDRRLMDAADHG